MNLFKILVAVAMTFVLIPHGMSQDIEFENPIAEQRADPWVYKTDDGTYYLIATVPEYDRIVIRKANTINGLKEAEEKTVWYKHEKGEMASHIWAPELHQIDGKWYIYFAAGESEDVWDIKMYALSNASNDPMKGKWKEEGQVKTDIQSFSLDATTFEHNGKHYMIWAQNVLKEGHGTGLVMSEMKDGTTLTGEEIVLTVPEYSWETRKYNVNEGAAVIKKDGRIFVTYSASATNHNYCVGLLWIDEEADIMDPANWKKSPGPVFYSNPDVDRFGPGHNSFTIAEDGETVVMIYHARDYKEIEGEALDDPNRATRARVVEWTESGFPDFMQHKGD